MSLRLRLSLAAAAALAMTVGLGLLGVYATISLLTAGGSPARIEELASSVMTSLAGFFALVVAGGAFFTYWLAGRILQPVHRLAETARQLGEGDLNRRLHTDASDAELIELADTLNGMLGRLEASFESLRRFTADASHELRAPLALVSTEVDLALAQARTPEEYRRALETVRDEVDHLTKVTEQLLMLARADAGALQPVREEIDVADFLHEAGARWAASAKSRSVSIEVTAPDSGHLMGDPQLLRRVVDNLLDNAVRHSPAGGTVRLRGERQHGSWLIDVADDGPGVPEELRDRLFLRFARASQSREPDGGAGLGLALSAAIASAHGGRLRLKPEAGHGAEFQLDLPAATPAPARQLRFR